MELAIDTSTRVAGGEPVETSPAAIVTLAELCAPTGEAVFFCGVRATWRSWAGADAFLPKPFSPSSLLQLLSQRFLSQATGSRLTVEP